MDSLQKLAKKKIIYGNYEIMLLKFTQDLEDETQGFGSFCYAHPIQYIERESTGVVYRYKCKAQLSTSQLQAISVMSCIIAHSSEAVNSDEV